MVSTGKMLAFINALGGGAAAPSEVVILPETVLTATKLESPLQTAPNAVPEVGAVCKVTYNGVAYECNALAIPEGLGTTGVLLGNTDPMGVPGGNATAPFIIMLFDEPVDMGNGITYGMAGPIEEPEEGTSITFTLSIVQVGGASGGETSGGGVFITSATSADMQNVTMDKPLEDAVAAARDGKYVACHLTMNMGEAPITVILPMVVFGNIDGFPSATYSVKSVNQTVTIADGIDSEGERLTELIMTGV